MNEEIWKDIDGYPGYKVSNLGRILSTRRGTERILSSSDDGNGYQKAYSDGVCDERSSISHVLRGDQEIASHYRFDYAGREDILLYGLPDY